MSRSATHTQLSEDYNLLHVACIGSPFLNKDLLHANMQWLV
uniref:Uncharacterized protein n=1 Tax=Arundo donax TaxID=35708 RepID=A0A0A9ETA6_ARUDO